jgi:hypothetical protein
MNFDFDAEPDPNPASHSDADCGPYPNPDPDPQACWWKSFQAVMLSRSPIMKLKMKIHVAVSL